MLWWKLWVTVGLRGELSLKVVWAKLYLRIFIAKRRLGRLRAVIIQLLRGLDRLGSNILLERWRDWEVSIDSSLLQIVL